MKKVLAASIALLALAGCATAPQGSIVADHPSDLPSIQSKYSARLAKLYTGMPLAQFHALFPETYVSGQNGGITAYELASNASFVTQRDIDRQNFLYGGGSPKPHIVKQTLWFYFAGGKLVRWGQPQDWPDKTNVIIERRER